MKIQENSKELPQPTRLSYTWRVSIEDDAGNNVVVGFGVTEAEAMKAALNKLRDLQAAIGKFLRDKDREVW